MAQSSESATSADFVRPHLKNLAAYTPIEPFEVLSAKLGRAPEDIIKLDANENPYGPPPEVLAALASMAYPHIYPDPENRQLRARLAEEAGVPVQNLLVGCGADELIDLLMRCTLEPGDIILDCPPTFGMYRFDAQVNNAEVVDVPRNDDFSIDVDSLIAAAAEHKPKIIFLTSPNNPSGNMLSTSDLERVLAIPGPLVCLDEAYIEFSAEASKAPWVAERENLVILRTFSKRAGLAGMRVGWGVFPSGLIEYMWRAKQPYNVSVASEVAAVAALSNPTYLQEVRDKLIAEREVMFAMLQSISYLSPYPSEANFILCKVEGRDAGLLKEELSQRGIMVRFYSKPARLAGCIRISVGKPEDTQAIKGVLESLQ
eukprot:CAMPEP_0196574294 /NCGR_PEP_ID=MMETSP1081-20130531/4043_1 /TAXON_ID=36882 /ORGANISM="Pyramimonas amylifera, Strain CCMP720" /LENGTH=371 /DNA_ID=CAMNT_0041892277 /DNA_START=172 /DNA_END=1287 /DNA_ORIENTATION=-